MHELNLCVNLIQILEQNIQKNQETFPRIKKIWIEVGLLAGIELDALQFSFPIAALNTIAENAKLEILAIEGQAWCEKCQKSISIKTYFSPCPYCHDYHYRITQGKELRISKMEIL